ncbi:MAG: SRPBCC family protein, partial [Planctomycetota bacterium]
FDIMVQYRFDAINDNKTRVAQTSVVKPKGWMMKTMFFLSGPFMRRMNCSAAMEEMQNLKRFCESSDRDQESP